MNPRDPHYPNRAEWLTRPARKQVDDATLQREIQARGGPGERNLWSGRRIGPSVGPPGGADSKRGGSAGQRNKDVSKYRCVVELDVGRTRGSDAKQHVFCLYFCKGCCSQGSACTYLHRLPTAEDEAYAVRDLSADIFGREKRAESEGYRSGAGTLDRDNRTLYVNYEGAGSYDLPKIRQLLDSNFRMFGPINNIYIVHMKTIAFVRYDWRSSGEFAKEALHKQTLVGSRLGEVITVRWANEDPNPVAVLAQKRACEEAFGLAVMNSFDSMPPEQKQARIMELQLQSAMQRGTAIGGYPATDDQFAEQERKHHLLMQQQAAGASAEGDDDGEEEEDIPYIPDDIYEEQQRLVAQRRDAAIDQSAQRQALPQTAVMYSDVIAELSGDVQGEVAHQEMGTGPGPAVAVGVTGEAPEWERAWSDPELREQLRANPELRERMRRARNEAVYWAAYQAHYTAYANSYGHNTQEQQQQQQDQGQQQYLQYSLQSEHYPHQSRENQDAVCDWQEYVYSEWDGQQAAEGEHPQLQECSEGVGIVDGQPLGHGTASESGKEDIFGDQERKKVEVVLKAKSPPAGNDEPAALVGVGVMGAGNGAAMGASSESMCVNRTTDGLSLLGMEYGSDDEDN